MKCENDNVYAYTEAARTQELQDKCGATPRQVSKSLCTGQRYGCRTHTARTNRNAMLLQSSLNLPINMQHCSFYLLLSFTYNNTTCALEPTLLAKYTSRSHSMPRTGRASRLSRVPCTHPAKRPLVGQYRTRVLRVLISHPPRLSCQA